MTMSIHLSAISHSQSSFEPDDDPLMVNDTTQTIYGRSVATKALLTTYERLLQTKKAQTVLVHGESGSGKTALVDTIRKPVCDSHGYFVAGKYFQNTAVEEPYSAIMAAFSDICDLVIQSDDFDQQRQLEIAKKLGADAQLLAKSISNLSPLVNDWKEADIDASSSFAKFRAACKKFLRAMASDEHPIVLFIDDIQWADEGSTQLIQAFLQDSELKNIMLILAYREEESAHIIQNMLDHVQDPTDIALSNLDSDAVHQVVTSIMGTNTDKIKQLSDLVAKRTCGNPFYVIMFMETIQQEGLLAYNSHDDLWIFDVDEIQKQIMVSETLADLLTRKIGRLHVNIKETLKVASLLGYNFDESIMLEVARISIEKKQQQRDNSGTKHTGSDSSSKEAAIFSLSEALKEGFIEKTSDGYQFAHDKLQSSFRSLIDEPEAAELHLLIGTAFLDRRDASKMNIYKAALHLNNAPSFIHDGQQRTRRLARMNLEAAQYCLGISAFAKAVTVLRNGLHVLGPQERWSNHFGLAFEMTETLARAELIIGDFEACKATTKEALCRGLSAEMNVKLFLIDVEVRMATHEVDATRETARQALRALGVKVPRRANARHILGKLMKVKFMLRQKTDKDILNLPFTDDILTATAIKLLTHICSFCILADESETAVFSALLATELTLKKGLSQCSSCAFAIYGVAEASLGNIDRAYRFGKLALAMLDLTESKEAECPTIAYALTMLSFRKERFTELAHPLYQAAKIGFQNGDIYYGIYSLSQSFFMSVHMGTHLSDLEVAMRGAYGHVCDLGQHGLRQWLEPTLQYVLNIQTDECSWENIIVLDGEIMNEEEYFREALEKNHKIHTLMGLLWKASVALDFGQFTLAASIYEECKTFDVEVQVRFSFGAPIYYCDQARVEYGLFELSRRRRHLRNARRYKRQLEHLDASGCPDATARLAFVVAYEASLQKKFTKNSTALSAAYDCGIARLKGTQNVGLEGILNERAGFDFAKRGQRTEAERFFRRALQIYEVEWGATVKYNQLKQRSAPLLQELRTGCANEFHHGRCIDVSTPLESLRMSLQTSTDFAEHSISSIE